MQLSLYINNRNVCLQLFELSWTLSLHQCRESLKSEFGNNKNLFVKEKFLSLVDLLKTSFYTDR